MNFKNKKDALKHIENVKCKFLHEIDMDYNKQDAIYQQLKKLYTANQLISAILDILSEKKYKYIHIAQMCIEFYDTYQNKSFEDVFNRPEKTVLFSDYGLEDINDKMHIPFVQLLCVSIWEQLGLNYYTDVTIYGEGHGTFFKNNDFVRENDTVENTVYSYYTRIFTIKGYDFYREIRQIQKAYCTVEEFYASIRETKDLLRTNNVASYSKQHLFYTEYTAIVLNKVKCQEIKSTLLRCPEITTNQKENWI